MKQELTRIKQENRAIKEKLEFFTDKYGIPNEYKLKEESVDESIKSDNLIDIETTKLNSEKYKKLVNESIRDLLKLQLSELLEIFANQNKQSIIAYNSIAKLRDQLKDK